MIAFYLYCQDKYTFARNYMPHNAKKQPGRDQAAFCSRIWTYDYVDLLRNISHISSFVHY